MNKPLPYFYQEHVAFDQIRQSTSQPAMPLLLYALLTEESNRLRIDRRLGDVQFECSKQVLAERAGLERRSFDQATRVLTEARLIGVEDGRGKPAKWVIYDLRVGGPTANQGAEELAVPPPTVERDTANSASRVLKGLKTENTPPTPSEDEEHPHDLERDTEDSLLTPGSSMNGIGESNTLEPLPQTATEKPFDPNPNEDPRKADLPENHRPARSDPKGGGHRSDQARRREERKAGKKPWEIQAASASTTSAVVLTKRQARKARTKGEAEKWLARHTSTSNS